MPPVGHDVKKKIKKNFDFKCNALRKWYIIFGVKCVNVIIALFLLATLRGYRKYYYYMSIQLNIISIYFLKILQFKYNLLVVTIKQKYIKRSKLKVVLKSSQSQAHICNISLNRLTNVDLCL